MTPLIYLFLVVCITRACSTDSSRTDQPGHQQKEPQLFRAETSILHSDIVNNDFEIQVSLPAEYMDNDSTYPVLFCTDANENFGLVSGIAAILSFRGDEIPPVVVVGIGYPLKGLEDWGARRHSDLTPTYMPERSSGWQEELSRISGRDDLKVRSGDAPLLLEFINQELIPFVESNYRVNSTDRAIFGYSLGGLFSLYALFHAPEIFQRYFAGEPSIWWDDATILSDEAAYAATRDDLHGITQQ